MKRNILILLTLFLSTAFCMAGELEEQVKKAYQDKDYTQAITLLETEIERAKTENGEESAELYYNLGNAYYRNNNVAKAILNYERAFLIDPADTDTRTNLQFLQTKIEDKFPEKDDFIIMSWLNAVQNLTSSNTWATIAIVLFIVFIGCLSAFFFGKGVIIKKAAFYAGIIVLVFLIFTNVFAYRQKSKVENRNQAIITSPSVPAYSSPNSSEKELFILHPGSKVKINKEDGDWVEVEIVSGDIGWIQKEKFEII